MDRREFLKRSGLVLGGLGVSGSIHPAILKAMNIKPEAGSTFYDAEHIVILMQENRSFDHCFGALQGVRGFGDKYAFRKPDGKSVFFQKDQQGRTYAPFNLDIQNTKATWMRSLPHNWDNQQAALNKGKMNEWLPSKRSGISDYADLSLTLGYYNREDLPFYYQLADAFTVFDQNFCSSLTGTNPNRLYMWTGTVREEQNGDSRPHIINASVWYNQNVHWKTFPEILEENNISWRIYQNEISLPKGMKGEQDPYLANFTNNSLEWFSQYHVGFSPKYYEWVQKKVTSLKEEIAQSSGESASLENSLKFYEGELIRFAPEKWNQLSDFEKSIHEKAFTINSGDPDFWGLEEIPSPDSDKMYLPKGDVLFQFRKDVKEGKLPAVSWVIAPERFSDHPTSPWYGAWYISEVLNILTADPEVWKKTIFILTYDENDGYFDHIVPFLPPDNPDQKSDLHGRTGSDYVDFSQKYFKTTNLYGSEKVEGPVGLGFRVPMIIASPWTLGGYVNSDVTDHTSMIMFLEDFLKHKTGEEIRTDLISNWRRSVCSDLTSAFRQENDQVPHLDFLDQRQFADRINAAKDKPLPQGFVQFEDKDQNVQSADFPVQEKGLRPANPLDYRYEVNLRGDQIVMRNKVAKGVPLMVYNRLKLQDAADYLFPYTLYSHETHQHAVKEGTYDWEIYGPNGFYRNFTGENKEGEVWLETLDNGDVKLRVEGIKEVKLTDHYTGKSEILKSGEKLILASKLGGWYDLSLDSGQQRWIFAGRAESGKVTSSDPHWS